MKILGLIPARGGSKGVFRKNIRPLNGRPLIAHTAESALRSKSLTRVILSTEDEEIAAVGANCGLDVPFMRPAELAEDKTPSLPVVAHALLTLRAQGEDYDAVCLLQPTNPLRRAEDIDACVELLIRSGADSVVSVLPVPHEYNPKWVFWMNEEGNMSLSTGDRQIIPRRQDLPPAFHRDGSVYVARSEIVLDRGSLYGENILGYEMSPEYSANIDTEEDWRKIEQRINRVVQYENV